MALRGRKKEVAEEKVEAVAAAPAPVAAKAPEKTPLEKRLDRIEHYLRAACEHVHGPDYEKKFPFQG